ncbi:MAG: N-acetylmuramoyl-L-alanine amidase [Carnobacterium sp.]|uniref:N-acetylmuramoyl-L-alanine amidase n=1 Tax=Carnobacterium sp. TaxID=48221 RepID=UPI003C7847D4
MLKINKMISKFNHYNGGNNVEYIVLHDVGALGQAKANADYFYNANRGASAHLFVDETSIWQSIEFNNPAWHVGDDKPNDKHDIGDLIHNRNSIGVEMCLDKNWKVTAKTQKNTVELAQHLMKLYPNAKVVRHYDASGKLCPRSMSGNNWQEWNTFYKRITGATIIPNIPHINTPNSHTVVKNDTLWGLSKQYNVSVPELKSWNNLKSDTIIVGQKLVFKKVNIPVVKPVVLPAPAPIKSKLNLPNGVYRYRSIEAMRHGNDVLQIQLALSSIYFYPNKGSKNNGCDGWFGKDTADAVRRFQSVYGLVADGVYGDITRKKLESLIK